MNINLTQTACQFVESENGVDRGFTTMKAEDCKAINAKTGADRLSQAQVLELKPGKYIFRVTNKNVPYTLGFWLRGKGLGRVTLPSVSGGGLTPGTTKDYVVRRRLLLFLPAQPDSRLSPGGEGLTPPLWT